MPAASPKASAGSLFCQKGEENQFSPDSCKDALFTQSMHVWGGVCVCVLKEEDGVTVSF